MSDGGMIRRLQRGADDGDLGSDDQSRSMLDGLQPKVLLARFGSQQKIPVALTGQRSRRGAQAIPFLGQPHGFGFSKRWQQEFHVKHRGREHSVFFKCFDAQRASKTGL